ncbi:unnamed protein product [Durusdinium trenchii]|uniref:Uncharacterized protein n=1 Tax=Durusdinium trenchii TaxID=1381693 RepID=A0ABP0NP03_9DINO
MGTTWSRGGRKKGPKQNLQKRLSCSMDVVPDMPGELSWGSKQKNRVKSTNSSSSKTSQRSSANSPHRKAVEELPQVIGSELQRATSKMSHSSRGEPLGRAKPRPLHHQEQPRLEKVRELRPGGARGVRAAG